MLIAIVVYSVNIQHHAANFTYFMAGYLGTRLVLMIGLA